jgi:RHS repeat-associated protein
MSGVWSAETLTRSNDTACPTLAVGLPQRISTDGVIPYLYMCNAGSSVPVRFDYVDLTGPVGAISNPGDGAAIAGTQTITTSQVSDGVGVQRLDFYLDRGGGMLGYLGTDAVASDGFSQTWDTKESAGTLWADGAYGIYAVMWDYKGNRVETNRPLVYLQNRDLGVRPYRPSLPVTIGAGLGAQVNLWNGNLTLSHALVSDPTLLGSLAIARTYNSLDTSSGVAGRGWHAGPHIDAEISFRKLIDHSKDAQYPQNVAELVETDGTPHYYQLSTGVTYQPYAEDFSWLVKNPTAVSDALWTLTQADGGRYTFDQNGDPKEYRAVQQSLDQPSYSYSYLASGKPTSVADPAGRGFDFTYDANGRIKTVVSKQDSARAWTFDYNTVPGTLSSVQDPVNTQQTIFNYDGSNRLNAVTTPAGVPVQFGYDASGRVSEVRELHTEAGTTFTYKTTIDYVSPSTTKVTRPKGNIAPCSTTPSCPAKYTTTYTLDSGYRLTANQITLPDGTTRSKSISWTPRGLIASETTFSDPSAQWQLAYDGAGNPATETDPLGATVQHRYDEGLAGLQASYFNNATLTPPAAFRRLDQQVDFSWGMGSPGTGVGTDNFSVRWRGYLKVTVPGVYTLYTTAHDGSRLYVDGRELIPNWKDPNQLEIHSPPVSLTAGLHPISLEYYETTGQADMSLSWESPPGLPKQVIPAANLVPGFNLETTRIDQLGNQVNYLYADPFLGRVTEQRETNRTATGATETLRTTFTYDEYGRVLTKTMPKGNDPACTGTCPAQYRTTYEHYGSGILATNPCTGTSYPQLQGLEKVSQPGLADVSFVYDDAGNIVRRFEGRGATCSTYDRLGRRLSVKAPDRSSATTYAYNPDGQLTSVTDPTIPNAALPVPSTYTYDDLGRLRAAKDAMAAGTEVSVTYTYDEHGNPKTRGDKTGIYAYLVDELDRMTGITDPAGRTYSFTYDPDGRLTERVLPNSTKAALAYDTAGRLTTYNNQTTAGAPLASFAHTYDARGRKLTEDGPEGLWTYRYDPLGRLEQVHDPATQRTRRYSFDLDSNRTAITLNAGWTHAESANDFGLLDPPINQSIAANWKGDDASFAYTLKFGFPFAGTTYTTVYVSTNGFLTLGSSTGSTARTLDLAAQTAVPALVPYARDLVVDPTSLDNPGRGIYLEESGTTSVRIRWKAEAKPPPAPPGSAGPIGGGGDDSLSPANFEIVLSSSGQVISRYGLVPEDTAPARVGVTSGNGVDFVSVPGYDRQHVAPFAQTITYAPAAAAAQATYSYNALDQLTGGTGLSGITYSSDGEQKTITGPSPRGAWSFTYEGRGLMRQATSGSTAIDWTLDGEGRAVKKTKGSAEIRYRFGSPGDVPAWEENASGALTTSFVSGPGGLLASYASGTPTFYLLNGHGDVVQTRDLSGDLMESYAYDEYGNPTSAQSPSRYGYVGRWQKERDPDSLLTRMGVRMYDPIVGRFTSWDPIESGDRNAYLYAGADPINGYDLDGTYAMEYDGAGIFGNPAGAARGLGINWRAFLKWLFGAPGVVAVRDRWGEIQKRRQQAKQDTLDFLLAQRGLPPESRQWFSPGKCAASPACRRFVVAFLASGGSAGVYVCEVRASRGHPCWR